MTTLLVIVGPIAAGKSTIAAAVADALGRRGRSVAVTDLDDVVMAQREDDHDELWARGRRVHAGLVGAWLREGADVVIAHGPVFTAEETATLLAHVAPDVRIVRVLLVVDVETALERVTADPTRKLSRHEPFLRMTHERFAELRAGLPPCDLTFDTAATSQDDIVRSISNTIGI